MNMIVPVDDAFVPEIKLAAKELHGIEPNDIANFYIGKIKEEITDDIKGYRERMAMKDVQDNLPTSI